MRSTVFVAVVAAAMLLSACQTKPTQQTTRNLTTYRVVGTPYDQIADAVSKGLQGTNANAVQIDRSFVPAQLPAKPARLDLVNPLGGSRLGALAEASGSRLRVPTCPDAPYVATGANQSMKQYGEATGYYVCLWPYEGGVNLDIYTSFSIQKGGLGNLGVDLARSVVGDSSQFIQRSIDTVLENVRATGATVEKLGELKA